MSAPSGEFPPQPSPSEHDRLLRQIMSKANVLLWQGRVHAAGERLLWQIDVPWLALDNPLNRLICDRGSGGLWHADMAPDLEQMNLLSERALRGDAPSYEHVFRIVGPDHMHWLREYVTIERRGGGEWALSGFISDITHEHEAREKSRRTEERLKLMLARTDCMLWQARVTAAGAGFTWEIDVPDSGLRRRIAACPGALRPDCEHEALDSHHLYAPFNVPEQASLDACSRKALETGAPFYEQTLRIVGHATTFWLQERVTIVPLAPGVWELSGVVFDITAQRELEVSRRTTEAHLQQILSRADCLLWHATVHDRAERLAWIFELVPSELQCRVFGADGLRTSRLFAHVTVPERADMDKRSTDAIRGGAPGYEQEFRVIRDGRTYWIHEQVTIKPSAPGTWELVGIMVDVSARHEAEEARRATEVQLHQLLKHADCLVWQAHVTLDAAGDVEWSDFYIPNSILHEKIFDQQERRPFLWDDEIHVPDLPAMNARNRAALHDGSAGYEQEFHVRRGDRVFWLHEQVSIEPLSPGRWMLVGVVTDLSARRAAEQALASEKERLTVTLQAMEECVITLDTGGRVQFINRAAEALTRCPSGTAVGEPIGRVCPFIDETGEQPLPWPLERVLRDGTVLDLPPRLALRGAGGRLHLIEGCCAPVHATAADAGGAVLVFRDVTERHRLKTELQRASKLESVGILAGGIAHDFNNILTAVMGNLTLASLDLDGASEAQASLDAAQRACIRARDLTTQLLTFAKGGDPVRTAVHLPALITEVAEFTLHGSRARCAYTLPDALWPLDADQGQISQIVQNLVLNAAQAMPDAGVIQISARNVTLDDRSFLPLNAGDYVQLTVTDRGVGIAPQDLARIFDPYFTTKKHGSGLGLATVYSIVNKHRGHILAESSPGVGTTFHTWLPALRASTPLTAPPSPAPVHGFSGRVLLLDDEEAIRLTTAKLLTHLGLTVETAIEGSEAVQKYLHARASGAPFDLVVMDLTIPGGMGGADAFAEIRRHDPAVTAIVSSGYSSDPVMANHAAYGFRGVVAKPYRLEDFKRVLREILPPARHP